MVAHYNQLGMGNIYYIVVGPVASAPGVHRMPRSAVIRTEINAASREWFTPSQKQPRQLHAGGLAACRVCLSICLHLEAARIIVWCALQQRPPLQSAEEARR